MVRSSNRSIALAKSFIGIVFSFAFTDVWMTLIVAYWSPSTPFSTSETQNSRVKSFVWTMHCSHCSAINACGTNCAYSFHIFKSSVRMRWTMVFAIPVLSAIILQLTWRLSFKTAVMRVMFLFVFVVPIFLPYSASLIDSSPTANQLWHQNIVSRDTDESPNTFTSVSHVFPAINPTLQQNFIAARCSKFFSIVIYNASTEHTNTILQNALILPHIDGLTSNLVCRWRRV